MPYSKKRKYSRRRTYKSKRAYKRPRVSNRLRTTIKRVVQRNMETKSIQSTSAVLNVYQIIANTEVFNIIPAISQGTTQSSRVGNRIKPVRFTLKIALIAENVNAYSAGASSTYFDIYVFKTKYANQGGIAPTSTDMTLFLQNGAGGDQYNGTVLDGLRPINSELFTLLVKKRCCLNNIANSALIAMAGYYQSTQPQKVYHLDLTKHLKDTWIYNDSNTNLANDNFYIAIGSTQCDGNFLGTTLTGKYQFITDLKYKDA